MHCSTSAAKASSSAPSLTTAPTAKWISATTPSRGALMVCSIFMASMMTSGVPRSTTAPGSTSSATILPGMGAVRRPPSTSCSPAWASGSCSVRRWLLPLVMIVRSSPWRTTVAVTRAPPRSASRLPSLIQLAAHHAADRRGDPADSRQRGSALLHRPPSHHHARSGHGGCRRSSASRSSGSRATSGHGKRPPPFRPRRAGAAAHAELASASTRSDAGAVSGNRAAR